MAPARSRPPPALLLGEKHEPARRFDAAQPNPRWVGDTTEVLIGSSAKVYLAAILDLDSRFVVGGALSAVNGRHLTLRALEMALMRRCPDAGLLHHSGTKAARTRVRTTARSSSSMASRAR